MQGVRRASTLLELIISLSLLSVIVLAAGAFQVASNRFFVSSERRANVLNEVAMVMEHMQKAAMECNSTGANPYIEPSDGGTYTFVGFFSKTQWVGYQINANRVQFCPNWNKDTHACLVAWNDLASKIVSLQCQAFPTMVSVTVVGRYDTAKPVDNTTNPSVTLQTVMAAGL